MKELAENWIKFFRESKCSTETLNNIFHFLQRYSSASFLSKKDFLSSVTQNESELNLLLKELVLNKIVSINAKCPYCSSPMSADSLFSTTSIIRCDFCQEEFSASSIDCIEVLDNSIDKIKNRLYHEGYDIDAKAFIEKALERKEIFYLITDIEDSQNLQTSDEAKYNKYLRILQDKVWANAIRKSEKVKLLMNGRGDTIVYAFIDLEDSLNVLLALGQQLQKVEDELRLSAHILHIPFYPKDRTLIGLNIEQKWDFNSVGVTDAYRLSGIKPKEWKELPDNYRIKFAVIGKAYDLFKAKKLNTLSGKNSHFKETIKKNGIQYEEDCLVGAI